MQFTSDNTGFAVGSYGGISPGGVLRTTNAGFNWQFTNFPYYSADGVSFLNDNTGYISSCNFGKSYVLKTTNSGINWICKDSINASFFDLKFHNINTGIVVAKYSGVFKTTNGGSNWFAQTGVNWHEPSCIWCFDADNWLVASHSQFINKTTNGGINWIVMDFANIGFFGKSLYFINSTTGFSLTDFGGIYKSTNKGDNWIRIDSINSFYGYFGNIFFVNELTGYLCGSGTYGNLYKTTNGGYNWISKTVFNSNIAITYVFFRNANTGYAGSFHGLIYKTTTGGNVFIKNITTEIPIKFSLYQNYPNPFNPETKIQFDIPKTNNILLKIYDITGKEIVTLVNEKLNAGSYSVDWDGSNYTSGVYLYRLAADDFKYTKRMVLVK